MVEELTETSACYRAGFGPENTAAGGGGTGGAGAAGRSRTPSIVVTAGPVEPRPGGGTGGTGAVGAYIANPFIGPTAGTIWNSWTCWKCRHRFFSGGPAGGGAPSTGGAGGGGGGAGKGGPCSVAGIANT